MNFIPKNRNKRNRQSKKTGRRPKTIRAEPTSRINFPLLPNSYHVKLEYQEEYLTDNASAGASEKFGLNHWAGRTPGYGSTFYLLYKYCQVLKVEYVFRVSSTVSAPFEAVLVPAPYQSSTTFQVLAAYRGRKIASSSGTNSINKIQLKGSYVPSIVEGVNTTFDKATWYIESNMNATAPQDPDTHGVWMAMRPLDVSTTGSYAVQVSIKYHCHFFSPVNTVLSQELGTTQSFMDEIWNGNDSDDDSDRIATIPARVTPGQPKALPGISSGAGGIHHTAPLRKKAAPKFLEKV